MYQNMKFCCIFGISQECVTKGTCSKLFKQLAKSDAVICNRVESFLYVFASYLGIQKNALWVTWTFAMYVKNTLSANHESKLVTFLGPPKSANQVKPTLNWKLKLAFLINRTRRTSIIAEAETEPGQSSQESVDLNKPETDGRKC